MKKRLLGLGCLLMALCMLFSVTAGAAAVYNIRFSVGQDGAAATFTGMGSDEPSKTVTGTGGKLKMTLEDYTYTITPVAEKGYRFAGWQTKDSETAQTSDVTTAEQISKNIDVSLEDGTIWIRETGCMVDYIDNLIAVFEKIPAEQPGDGGHIWFPVIAGVGHPFDDVRDSDWFDDAVTDVYLQELMEGTGYRSFSPNAAATRAMVVTTLWRMSGSPMLYGEMPFSDVDSGAWYAEAVKWAAGYDIVEGITEDTFAPDDPITREQMAAILYRFARYHSHDLSGSSLTGFSDADAVSDYAADAVAWAVDKGILEGSGGALAPQATLTRAQMAAVLSRFVAL